MLCNIFLAGVTRSHDTKATFDSVVAKTIVRAFQGRLYRSKRHIEIDLGSKQQPELLSNPYLICAEA
jgi:hypothetical protein